MSRLRFLAGRLAAVLAVSLVLGVAPRARADEGDDDDDSGGSSSSGSSSTPAPEPNGWQGHVDGGPTRGMKLRKPTDPDTEVRLTGQELSERGVTNLAEALDLLPEMNVHQSGRGGTQSDLRGSRKGSVMILIDGVPVSDPYRGLFDVSSIPVTDIVEIRVSSASASPLDGAGGPGGVIEVITMNAKGNRRLAARAQASSAPDATAAVSGRAEAFPSVFVRASASTTYGGITYAIPMPDGSTAPLDARTRNVSGALRVEHDLPGGSVSADLWVAHRAYFAPPGAGTGAAVLDVSGEDTGRLALRADTEVGGWRVIGRGYGELLTNNQEYFADPQLTTIVTTEQVSANRQGLAVKAEHPVGDQVDFLALGSFDSESAHVVDMGITPTQGRSSIGEVATGAQARLGDVRLDGAVGLGWPLTDGAKPWPEAKLGVVWSPTPIVDIKLTGARKGRLPTIRERFDPAQGNPGLGVEMATFGEAGFALRPASWVSWKGSGYYRVATGMIKVDLTTGKQVNLGEVDIRGGETTVEVAPKGIVGGGASYVYEQAAAIGIGQAPLDFLPEHRVDAWVSTHWRAKVGATARVRYVSSQQDGGMTLDPYTTIDASAYWRVSPELRTTLRVDNALDDRYQIRASGLDAPGRLVLLSAEGIWE